MLLRSGLWVRYLCSIIIPHKWIILYIHQSYCKDIFVFTSYCINSLNAHFARKLMSSFYRSVVPLHNFALWKEDIISLHTVTSIVTLYSNQCGKTPDVVHHYLRLFIPVTQSFKCIDCVFPRGPHRLFCLLLWQQIFFLLNRIFRLITVL